MTTPAPVAAALADAPVSDAELNGIEDQLQRSGTATARSFWATYNGRLLAAAHLGTTYRDVVLLRYAAAERGFAAYNAALLAGAGDAETERGA